MTKQKPVDITYVEECSGHLSKVSKKREVNGKSTWESIQKIQPTIINARLQSVTYMIPHFFGVEAELMYALIALYQNENKNVVKWALWKRIVLENPHFLKRTVVVEWSSYQ